MRINADRLHASLERMAQIGATPGGGVTRLALSDEDRAARDLLRSWMEEAGLTVRIDDLGNMVGRRPGLDPGALPVQIGSHCDSVRRGGRYDGVLGVLGGLEVIRTLNDLGIQTASPIELINWTNEEGVRFEPAMLCSGVVAGRFTREYAYSRTDREGVPLREELRRIGYLGEERHRPGHARAHLELHIEQGPVLEEQRAQVGVVEGIVGITWCEVTVSGKADHAGPSPMHLRRDALVAASQIIGAIPELVGSVDSEAVGTVGRIQAEPNLINVIPDRVVFSVDLRHPQAATLESLCDRLQYLVVKTAAQWGVRAELHRFWTSPPTAFSAEPLAAVRAAAEQLGVDYAHLWSGAGHDAKYVQEVSPTAMIFIRSRDGLSHNEAEYSAPADVEAGANTLLLAAAQLAGWGG